MASFSVIIKGIPPDVPRWEAIWEWAHNDPSGRQTIHGSLPENRVTFGNVPDVGLLYIAHYSNGTFITSTKSPDYPGLTQVKDGATYEVTYSQRGWSQVKTFTFPFILAGALLGLLVWFKRKR